MIKRTSVIKIQNLVVNHEPQPVKVLLHFYTTFFMDDSGAVFYAD